ncbi:AMP-binding protein [Bradyrhizobium sp. RDT10]
MSWPPFADADDVSAFESTPLETRLAGNDLLAMFRLQVERDSAAPAIVYVPDGIAATNTETFSRRQLLGAVQAITHELTTCGIQANDVIASLLPNGPGTIAASLAAMAVGCLAPINIYLEESQIRTLLQSSGAKVVMVPREAPTAIATILSSLQQGCRSDGIAVLIVDTATLPQHPPIASELKNRDLSELVALFHTGGTTGLPKFVPLTASNLAAGAVISGFAYGYAAAERVLCAMPMFHVGGLFACSLFPLIAGSEVAILGPLGYRGDGVVAALPSTIEQFDLDVVVGPPTIMAKLAARPPDRARAPRLRLFINGAAALPSVIGTRLSEATHVAIVEPWGLTEATLAVTSGPRDGTIQRGSVGLRLPYCGVKAVRTDAAGKFTGDCDVDEIGVLAVRGPMVFRGYLGREATEQPFFEGDWLDTGDLGRVDINGFVWVTGRAKELIKRGGHGIDPGMIENALSAHPAVALAAAVGKPDAYAGEIPVAYVELRPGDEVLAEELIAFARDRIPERAAIPKEIIIVPRLPVTAIGKVHKQTLKVEITGRAAEECVRAVLGDGEEYSVTVEPHPLHGLQVNVHVPAHFVEAVREKLATLPFRSQVDTPEQKEM